MNGKNKILELVKKEDIEAISLGNRGSLNLPLTKPLFFGKDDVDKALFILDFEYDSGYGREEAYSVYVWTKEKIIVKAIYDGSEWYTSIPRNPNTEIIPEPIGDG